ncbi:hypothetical protein ABBQ38_005966 [Trebouxia sp. C0009 RCD-2024]
MSGKGQTSKNCEQGGVLDSVKEAGKTISNEVSKTTGGSQVGDVVQEKESGGAKKVAKE